MPVVIHHHGYEGYVTESSADWLEEECKVKLLKAVIAGGGCAIAGSHACGDHFGRADAVEANGALLETLVESAFIDRNRVGLKGGGLGGFLIWNSVLGPIAGRVKAAAALRAPVGPEAFVRAQKHMNKVLVAYGLSEDTPVDVAAAKVAPHDPLPQLEQLPTSTPLPRTAIYLGSMDRDVLPESQAIPLVEAVRKAGGHASVEFFPDVSGSVYMMGRPIEQRVEAFFASAL